MASLPEPSSFTQPHYSFLIHKHTPPSPRFGSHQDQVDQLAQLPVTRSLPAAVMQLRRRQSHRTPLESSDKNQAGFKHLLFSAISELSLGNQLWGSKGVIRLAIRRKASCRIQLWAPVSVKRGCLESRARGRSADRWTTAKKSTEDYLAGVAGAAYKHIMARFSSKQSLLFHYKVSRGLQIRRHDKPQ